MGGVDHPTSSCPKGILRLHLLRFQMLLTPEPNDEMACFYSLLIWQFYDLFLLQGGGSDFVQNVMFILVQTPDSDTGQLRVMPERWIVLVRFYISTFQPVTLP